MQFDPNVVPPSRVRQVLLLFVAFWLVLLCLAVAFATRNTLAAIAVGALTPPLPATVTRFIVPTAKPTQWPTALLTATSVPSTATAKSTSVPTTEPAPTAIPSPTRFYIIPAQPTALPTPDLPPAAPFPATCDGPGRINIMLVGIDGVTNNYYRAARSDTIIMLGVNFASKTANMLSIPRDLWVPLTGLGQLTADRINTAYHYGELFGVPGGGPAALSTV